MKLSFNYLIQIALILVIFSQTATSGVTPLRKPRIFLEYSTRRSPLDLTKIKMWVDGIDVTRDAEVNPSEISYIPKNDLSIGKHAVEVQLVDRRGVSRKKKWNFTIDPSTEVPRFTLKTLSPTPKNGDVVNDNEVHFKFQLKDALSENISIQLYLAHQNQGYVQLDTPYRIENNIIEFKLTHLQEGAKTLLLKASHRSGSSQVDLQTSFLIDHNAPRFIGVHLSPNPYRPEHGKTSIIEIQTMISDPPFHTAKDITMTIPGPGIKRIKISQPNVYERHTFRFNSTKLVNWKPGKYEVQIKMTDYSGRDIFFREPLYLEILDESSETDSSQIQLKPYPTSTRNHTLTFDGKAIANATVRLYINDQQSAQTKTALLGENDAGFTLPDISLSEGFNKLALQLFNIDEEPLTERISFPGILVDSTPPLLDSIIPEVGQELVDLPEIRFKARDLAHTNSTEGEKLASGLYPPSARVTLDGKVLPVIKKKRFFSSKLKEPLPLGDHQLDLYLEDKLGNRITHRSSFKIVPGPPFVLNVVPDKRKLYSWGSEFATLNITVQDKLNRPVEDGTPVFLSATKGLVPQIVRTRNGKASARYIPSLELGTAQVKIWTATGGLKKNLPFRVINAPERIPFSTQIIQSQPSIPADNGKSKILFKVSFKDAFDQTVANGINVQISAQLGRVSARQLPTKNGTIMFNYMANKKPGRETLLLKVMDYEKKIHFPVTMPDPGPPAKIVVKLKPLTTTVNNILPLRVTAEIFDSEGVPVKDATPVRFQTDLGQIVPGARSLNGKVINSFFPPEQPGVAKVLIESGLAKTRIEIPILPNPTQNKLDSIWLDLPQKWTLDQEDVLVKGQLLGKNGQMIKGKSPIYVNVSQGKAPSIVICREGTFDFRIRPHQFGPLTLTLRCEEVSLSKTMRIVNDLEKRSINTNPEVLLDLEYQKTAIQEELIMGYLNVQLVSIDGRPLHPDIFNGRVVQLSCTKSELPPKVYIINNQAKIPFNYKRQNEDIIITAKMGALKSSLSLAAENLQVLTPAEYATVHEDAKGSALFKMEYQKKTSRDVHISLKLVQGIVPSPVVQFTARRGKIISGSRRSWFGDVVTAVYRIPEQGSIDHIKATCGSIVKELELDLDALRKKSIEGQLPTPGKDTTWELQKGIKLVHLSGKTRLQAGGKDRTRLRFRILNYKNENLPDGTIVDLICPQANIAPNKAKIQRGVISVSLRSKNWVGTYPLVLRIGDIREKVDLSFVAPPGSATNLPDFPDGPENRNRRSR